MMVEEPTHLIQAEEQSEHGAKQEERADHVWQRVRPGLHPPYSVLASQG